jgi:hypothetical protein
MQFSSQFDLINCVFEHLCVEEIEGKERRDSRGCKEVREQIRECEKNIPRPKHSGLVQARGVSNTWGY